MKKLFTKEVRIAFITLVSLVVLYVGLNHLKGINVFKPANHYYISMPDVSELQVSSPVYVDGFKVGIVNAIHFGYDRPGNILVQVSLDKEMKIPAGSYAELKSSLTSGAYLSLKLNTYVSTYLTVGDTITGQPQLGLMDKLSSDLVPQVEHLLPRLDSILSGIQLLVNHPALNQSLNHIEATTAGLQKSSEQLNVLLAKEVPEVLSNLNKVSSDFSVVSGNLREVDIQSTMASLDQAVRNIRQITQQLNDSTNSLGLLLNDRSLYEHLDSTARNASDLLLDLKQHPKRYVHFSVF
ncbi:MAG: MlaD family protein [Dysgonamonadaceae bacterium]|jgi:phospholipid/cholesterol/gamma-HCH transport system substrate-binding protein|nr:MlaD family protein [Dysgonamonadaceae bacterium]